MADNVSITAGTGTTIACDEVTDGTLGSCKVQYTKIMDGTLDGTNKLIVTASGEATTKSRGTFATISTDITRPNDTNPYTVNDALSDSTSAPTAGGFTFTNAVRISGGSGIITDFVVASSNIPATFLSGEIWLFDTSVTAVNDNAAFAISDAEVKTVVGILPFTLGGSGNNSIYTQANLSLGFTCVGSANLRFLVKVKNAYTPAAQEVLTTRLKILQVD